MEKSLSINKSFPLTSRFTDYIQLTKMKLSMLVVFSAALAFIIGSDGDVNWGKLLLLVIGGFLVTGSANAFNQVIERDFDRQMDRTKSRPLPDGRMKIQEAVIVAIIFGLTGLTLLTVFMNLTSGILGLIAILSYTLL